MLSRFKENTEFISGKITQYSSQKYHIQIIISVLIL